MVLPEDAPWIDKFLNGQPVPLLFGLKFHSHAAMEWIVWIPYVVFVTPGMNYGAVVGLTFILAIVSHMYWYVREALQARRIIEGLPWSKSLPIEDKFNEIGKAIQFKPTVPVADWELDRLLDVEYPDMWRVVFYFIICIQAWDQFF